MTHPRSPAAQAVKDAVLALYQEGPARDYAWPLERAMVNAVLHAGADQVVPANGSRKNNEIRAEILAIAAELGGGR